MEVFETSNQDLAVGLHASNSLKFIGCEPTSRSYRVAFRFEDPNHKALDLRLQYERGELTAPVNVTLASLRFLRRKAEDVPGVRRG
jgi:hypothetical protein